MYGRNVSWAVVMGLCASAAGCAGASWQKVNVSSSYQAPKQLKIALVSETSHGDVQGAMRVMQGALKERLSSKGVVATFVAAPSGETEANVTIAEWDPGSRAVRWLTGIAGEGSIVVRVKSPSSDGATGVEGTARGWVKGGWFGGNSDNAAIDAGHLIADAIATGKTD